MSAARILVVEDESIVALNLQNRLKSMGYEIAGVAAAGEEAVKKAEETRPDLVLMDIMLQGEMDGIGAADQIRRKLDLPVIYLTAYADEVTLNRAKITEPFGYILKPFEVKEIRTTIEISLYKHRMERLLRESEERYALAVDGANDGIWDWDLLADKVYYSSRWKAILGFKDEEIGDSPEDWLSRVHPEERPGLDMALARHLDRVTPHLEYECRMLASNGTHRWVFVRGLAVRTTTGKPTRMAGSLTDTTRRHQAEDQVLRVTEYDTVTGLANESLFLERVWELTHAKERYAILRFSLTGFDSIYREKGPAAAHEMAAKLGGLLSERFKAFTCARLYGGEFAVLLPGLERLDEASGQATALAESAASVGPVRAGAAICTAGRSSDEVLAEAGALSL